MKMVAGACRAAADMVAFWSVPMSPMGSWVRWNSSNESTKAKGTQRISMHCEYADAKHVHVPAFVQL